MEPLDRCYPLTSEDVLLGKMRSSRGQQDSRHTMQLFKPWTIFADKGGLIEPIAIFRRQRKKC